MTTTEGETRWDVGELREDYLAALERLLAASQGLRDALTSGASALMVVREQAENGATISDLFAVVDPKPLRTGLTSALTELERARHAAQKLLFRILFIEGTNMSDIARHWGISRQLVSRLINEPD